MSNTLHFNNLEQLFAAKAGVSIETAHDLLKSVIDTLSDELKRNECVEIQGLGIFSVQNNRDNVIFTPCTTFSSIVNNAFEAFETTELAINYPGLTPEQPQETAETESMPVVETNEPQPTEIEAIPAGTNDNTDDTDTAVQETPSTPAIPEPYENQSHDMKRWIFWLGLVIGVSIGFLAGFFLRPTIMGTETTSTEPVGEIIATDTETTVEDITPTSPSDSINQNNIQKEIPSETNKTVYDTIQSGRFLTTISRRHYGGRHEFWIYIYQENKDKIADPQNVPIGTVLVVPDPEKYGIDPNSPESIEKAKEATRLYEKAR